MALFIPTAMNKEEINVCIDCGESIKLGWYYCAWCGSNIERQKRWIDKHLPLKNKNQQ
jgi:predicted RNA-binding Zn-ribbon protein involved in translation (DUF1610 family)